MDDKILYPFNDYSGETSTLTLDKVPAETLQKELGDVHVWVQSQYNDLSKVHGEAYRRFIGDLIRERAWNFWSDHCDTPDDF